MVAGAAAPSSVRHTDKRITLACLPLTVCLLFLSVVGTTMLPPSDKTFLLFPQLLVNRSKRKRRRRADKPLTGSEKVKVINMRTGKKVRLTVKKKKK